MSELLSRGEFTRCEKCYGNGTVTAYDGVTKLVCPDCLGLSVKLTDIGRELVVFLAEHFDLTPKAKVS